MGALHSVGSLIISTLGGLYIFAVLLRFLLQIARADFYNPLSQAIVAITNPAVRIFRRFVPGYRGVDFASLLLAFLLQCAATALLIYFSGYSSPGLAIVVSWSAAGLLSMVLNIYFWGMIISIIASFIAPYSPHPALVLIRELTDPVMAPFRRLIPAMGGLDISPIFALMALQIIRAMLVDPMGVMMLVDPMGVNPTVVLGL